LVDRASLKDPLARNDLKRLDKVLLIVSCDSNAAKTVGQIREIARESGLSKAKMWNLSAILAKSDGCAVRVKGGWELTSTGKSYVSSLLANDSTTPIKKAAALRAALPKIKDADTRAFLSEAVECQERELYRAAVVFSWVGAISLLYLEVVNKHLSVFNAEATRRDAKWRPATNRDGLARMNEHKFLEVIEAMSIIGKNVKEELQGSLKLRNSCGHPNSFKLGEHKVAAHIETLLLNVFVPFS